MSPLQPVTIEDFGGGLDLRAAPNESRGAIDLLNVTFDHDGIIRARDGTTTFNAAASGAAIIGLGPWYASDGTRHLVYNNGTNTIALATNGVQAASTAQSLGISASFVRYGVPGAEALYIIGGNTIRKWNGTAFSSPASGAGYSAAVQVTDNRMAVNSGGLSRVWFSNAGAPETYGANDWVELTPGDGERIMTMVTWRELVFAFKNSKFFVFYGNSTDASGNPIFNFRPVVAAGTVSYKGVCAARDAVYFIGNDGIYRTTGGPPEIISGPLDPLWTGRLSPFSQIPAIDKTAWQDASIAAVGERIYVAVPLGAAGSSQSYILVYDIRYRWWSVWSIAMTAGNQIKAMASFQINAGTDELVFGGFASPNYHIYRTNSSYTTDAFGQSIGGRYQSGFQDFGIAGEKKIRETLVDGTGTVTLAWARDWGSPGSGQALTLGTSPAVANSRSRIATRGRLLSWQVSGTAPWSVQRVMPMLMGARHPGAKTTA